ncbi:purine permease [Pseudomonas sp. LS44]|uniref:nucleobase:cation symporter-2 family protein n=1 Tax=Pseudomonas sp. LS44 TaxID=1357074 RepID=UPI00215AF33A|nr:nucleobase:cation symporter-2 family protein [Pseudomonas sp. LS44]UVE19627.1 purine permease [Pseudomonas sp. LS44]
MKNPSVAASSHQRPEDENLGIGANLAYGLQHVLTMYGGIVAVPLIIGQAAGLSPADIGLLIAASLFAGGLATLLQTLGLPFFGCQLPLVQGVSFAGVATMIAIIGSNGAGGIPVVLGAVIAASLIGLLITPIFSRITKFFPPLVTGIVITTIGLTLMPVAARWAMGGNSQSPEFGSMANIGLAAVTLGFVLLFSKLGNASISRLSILLAMVIGTVIAVFCGMADFSNVLEGPLVAMPNPLHFGMPEFQIAAILSMLIVIIVTLVETSADILAVGEIIGTKVDSKRLGNGLRADMISSSLAPIFGSFTQSAFAQNVGLVAVTGIKSRYVVAYAGLILVTLGLLPVMGRLIAAVPTAVLGGAGVVLFGTVAASGIRTLAQVDYRNNMNLIIVATSIGFGMIPIAAPTFYHHFPAWFETIFHSGISSAAIMAIALNLLFNHFKAGNSDQQSVFVAASERTLRVQDIAALNEGDYFQDGKLFDADGNEVPVLSHDDHGYGHDHAAPKSPRSTSAEAAHPSSA